MNAKSLFLAPVLALSAAVAQAEVSTSGYVSFTNDFVFRGISLSDEGMAVQGQLSAQNEQGFYATLWGSSTSLGTAGNGSGLEGNFLLGLSKEVGDIGYDVGVIHYFYPGADNRVNSTRLSFSEVYGSLSYKGVTVGAAYSDDFFAETGKYLYTYAGYEHALTEKLSATGRVGFSQFDTDAFLGQGRKDYLDYFVGLTYTQGDFSFSAGYSGVDSDGRAALNGDGLGTDNFIFAVTRSF